ncbi:MAG: glycosyltransferase, partial [Halanaerobium sp.]
MNNIAFLNNSGYNTWGGVEKWTYKMAKALQNRGHFVVLYAREESVIYKKFESNNLPVEKINKISSTSFINPFRISSLSDSFKKIKIDSIFFCSSPTFKLGTVTAKIANLKNIIYRRGSAIPIKNNFYNRFLLRHITAFISNSLATKNESLKNFGNYLDDKMHLIYNGVNIDKFINVKNKSNLNKEFGISSEK